MQSYKERYDFSTRSAEASKILRKYPDRIPILVFNHTSSLLPVLSKFKYLVPEDITMGQFAWIIRKRIKLRPEQAIFMFVDGKHMVAASTNMRDVYNQYKDVDSFLYVSLSGEEVYG
jgi:GABA(A) receptor-associated protein